MNRDHDYGGIVDNQIRALDHIGLFKTRLAGSPESLPRFVNPYDEKADLSEPGADVSARELLDLPRLRRRG